MLTRRVLGGVALGGLAAAAIAFAVVDQSTTITRSCRDATAACAHQAVPGLAIVALIVGIVALVVGLIPAVGWVFLTVRAGHAGEEPGPDTAEQAIEDHRRALSDEEP